MWEDHLLIRRLRCGDQTALRRIYQKYKDDMLAIATSMLADLAAAEDCVHDVFVDFAAGAAEFRLRSSLKGYLLTCVANRVRDHVRKNSHEASLANSEGVGATTPEPTTQLIAEEQAVRLPRALAELPYEQCEVIVLHLQGDLHFREIGELQGVSINTVQSRYRYGLNKLRLLMKEGARK